MQGTATAGQSSARSQDRKKSLGDPKIAGRAKPLPAIHPAPGGPPLTQQSNQRGSPELWRRTPRPPALAPYHTGFQHAGAPAPPRKTRSERHGSTSRPGVTNTCHLSVPFRRAPSKPGKDRPGVTTTCPLCRELPESPPLTQQSNQRGSPELWRRTLPTALALFTPGFQHAAAPTPPRH